MTLLELMLVMLLMALILGGGLSVFSSLDLGKRQAAGLVRNVLRSAQNTAIATAGPARVRLDKLAGRLWAESSALLGALAACGSDPAPAVDAGDDVVDAEFEEVDGKKRA